MTRAAFREYLIRALNLAAAQAERRLGSTIPRTFRIELHAPGLDGQASDLEDVVDHLYLGADRFYRIIDVAITRVLPEASVAFVRVSGHPPVEFARTWAPDALGPFKQMQPDHVQDERVHSG